MLKIKTKNIPTTTITTMIAMLALSSSPVCNSRKKMSSLSVDAAYRS